MKGACVLENRSEERFDEFTPMTAAQAFGYGLGEISHPVHGEPSPRFRMKLVKDQVWRIEVERSPLPLRVLKGAIWITQDGEGEDHVVKATPNMAKSGFTLNHLGGVTVSALENALIEVG
jgi:hypothetical protein